METSHSPSTKRASIRDVAKEAGVSHTTVSLILNGKTSGSSVTRRRVLEAVERLDYQPDALFRKAVTERSRARSGESTRRAATRILAFILPRWMEEEMREGRSYYHHCIAETMEAAAEQGYHILLCPEDSEPGGIPSVIQDDKVDGILFGGTFPRDWVRLLSRRLPVVYLDRCYPELDVVFVTTNWLNSARTQLLYAWERGHRNVAFCEQHHPTDTHFLGTYRGYLATLESLGAELIHPRLSRVRTAANGARSLVEAFVEEWLRCDPRPTVIFCVDYFAAMLVQELKKRNLRVPEDVSIIGRMGDVIAAVSDPPLTSYEYPIKKIAARAVSMLVDAVGTGELHPAHLMLEGRMIERSSVKDLSAAY